jgi:hypothetical protein
VVIYPSPLGGFMPAVDGDHIEQFMVQCNINVAARWRLTTSAGPGGGAPAKKVNSFRFLVKPS